MKRRITLTRRAPRTADGNPDRPDLLVWSGARGPGRSYETSEITRRHTIRETHDREATVSAAAAAIATDGSDTNAFRFRARQADPNGPDGWTDTTHLNPYCRALNERPGPAMSAEQLRAHLIYARLYAGEAWLWAGGGIVAPIIGGTVEIHPPADGETYDDGTPKLVGGYTLRRADGTPVGHFPEPGPIVRIHIPHPQDPLKPYSVIAAAGLSVDVAHAYRAATRSVLANDGLPPGIVSVDLGELRGESATKRLREISDEINSRSAGGTAKGRYLALSKDATFTPMRQGSLGREWVEIGRYAREDVLRSLRVPSAALGDTGDQTYENLRPTQAFYLRSSVIPHHNAIAGTLTELSRRDGLDHEVWLDYSAVPELQESADELAERRLKDAQRVRSLWEGGLLTLNEARAHLGEEPVPDGDVRATDVPVEVAPAADGGERSVGAGHPVPFVRRNTAAEEVAAAMDAAETAIGSQLTRHVRRIHQRAVGIAERRGVAAAANIDLGGFRRELADDLPGWIGAHTDPLADALTDGLDPRARDLLRDAAPQEVAAVVAAVIDGGDGADPIHDAIAEALGHAAQDAAESDGDELEVFRVRSAERLGVSDDRTLRGRAGRWLNIATVAATRVGGFVARLNRRLASEPDLVEVREWRSMRDELVRDTHVLADGQRRAVGEPFVVGGVEMDGPHDPSAPLEETINCRCFLLPIPPSR